MAHGLEVIQALLHGALIRPEGSSTTMRLHWCTTCREVEYVQEGGGHTPPTGMSLHELWHFEWEISYPSRTFAEAVAAMDQGMIVERSGVQYRLNQSTQYYEVRTDGLQDTWTDAFVWTPEDLHAEDWKLGTAGAEDVVKRPTRAECARTLFLLLAEYSLTDGDFATYAVQEFWGRWPEMFREEE